MGATLTQSNRLIVPRAIRCAHCQGLAREEARERVSDNEVVVRYGCPECRWHRTRHYFEDGLNGSALNGDD